LIAALCALEALVHSDVKIKGSVALCAVAAHKIGGVGTRALLQQGITADACINLEHSANSIATVCVGRVPVRIETRSPALFFRFSQEARQAYLNPIEQQSLIIEALGTSLDGSA